MLPQKHIPLSKAHMVELTNKQALELYGTLQNDVLNMEQFFLISRQYSPEHRVRLLTIGSPSQAQRKEQFEQEELERKQRDQEIEEANRLKQLAIEEADRQKQLAIEEENKRKLLEQEEDQRLKVTEQQEDKAKTYEELERELITLVRNAVIYNSHNDARQAARRMDVSVDEIKQVETYNIEPFVTEALRTRIATKEQLQQHEQYLKEEAEKRQERQRQQEIENRKYQYRTLTSMMME